MAITYSLAPIPKWVIMKNDGEAAGGAYLYTYRSQNKIQNKNVYQDPAGTIPWSNPIIFDANGVQGPFYWEVDSTDLDETYYIEAWTGNKDTTGLLLWTLDDYFPPGEGGGGNATTYVPLENMIANNVFIDHIDDTANPINLTNLVIAPSNHKGFTPDLINPVVGTNGVVGPDIRFVKNNTNATDQITFVDFSLSDGPLTDDVTPVQYLRYQCTNSPAAESFKAFQFPINQKVKNLAGKEVTFTVWAKCGSGTENIVGFTRQYFGSGGSPSAEARTSFATYALTTTWVKQKTNFVIPSVAGMSIGTAGQQTDDDALYIQLQMPLGEPCDIWFTKPSLYVGDVDPSEDYETYDEIYGVAMNPRTGTIMTSLMSSAPRGWVAMNDGSIGSASSGATNRANKDTFFLFKTLWDGVSNTYAPTQDNAGVPVARGASAVADFVANRRLVLPRSLGRALAGSGAGSGLTSRALGEYLGTETISIADMPAHTHPGTANISGNVAGAAAVGITFGANDQASNRNVTLTVASQGGDAANGKMQPTSFMNVFIKL